MQKCWNPSGGPDSTGGGPISRPTEKCTCGGGRAHKYPYFTRPKLSRAIWRWNFCVWFQGALFLDPFPLVSTYTLDALFILNLCPGHNGITTFTLGLDIKPQKVQIFLVSTPSPIHITNAHVWTTLFWLDEVCTEMFRPWNHAGTTSGNPNFHIDYGNPDNVWSRSGNPYSLFACIIHHLIFKFVTLSLLIRP